MIPLHRLLLLFPLLTTSALQGAERIVSIGPATTELLQALGAETEIVATDVSSQGLTVPRVGYHRALAAEGILSMAPTRVIGSDEMGPPSTLEQLSRAGVKVEVLATTPTLENLRLRIDTLASLLGAEARGKELKARIADEVDALARQTKRQHPPRVALLLLHKGQPLSLAGGDTTADALIALAGGENLGKGSSGYKPLSAEALIQMQPDLVLVSGRDWQAYRDPATVLAEVPALASTPAGQHGRLHAVDGHALQGGLSLSSLAQARHIATWLTAIP
ncbi:heme/hemin ABC transporter substrate-binding protein [Aeromonas schubertii]|uniref:heme/hemin ABC transporter substrate-binding protein n=1 Tax=Aeromonas schubertii TaxID=652 RepID=UPI001CC6AFF2|nr:ABC transporter substrate-binding protein [Aeromonas schubertii]MBZ6072176.1 ABC transporter substrate-binding protein [Aeromonas schubertii]